MFTIMPVNLEFLKNKITPKNNDINKSDNGKLLIVGGSESYRGCMVLSSKAALRSGTGIVSVASVEEVVKSVASSEKEVTYTSLLTANDGSIGYNDINISKITNCFTKISSLLIGPGLTVTDNTKNLLESIIENIPDNIPVVFDADALNIFSSENKLLEKTPKSIITPHMGEMSRLLNIDISELKNNKYETVSEFSKKNDQIVVLKDFETNIFIPDLDIAYKYSFPNPGLAKGGSGDILSGIIASLCAQGYSKEDAAVMGVIIHAEAAKIAASELSPYYMQPSDIIKYFNQVFKACDR